MISPSGFQGQSPWRGPRAEPSAWVRDPWPPEAFFNEQALPEFAELELIAGVVHGGRPLHILNDREKDPGPDP